MRHPSASDARHFNDAGGQIVKQRLTILSGHLDRVAGARAAAPIRRCAPGDLGSHASRVVDRGAHEPARHRARPRGRGGRAARCVQGAQGERRSHTDVAAGRRPPDNVVDQDLANRGNLLERGRVRTRHGSRRNRHPGIPGRHPLLQGAPEHLRHSEALRSLAEEMRRRQFDGLPARGVEHHRPRTVDRDLEARRLAFKPGQALDHHRDIVHAVGKLRRLEQPGAGLGIASDPTHRHVVDRDVHEPIGLRDPAEPGSGVRRLAIALHAGIRQSSKDERGRGRRRGHDREGELLGECSKALSKRARGGDRTEVDLVLAGGEGGLGGHRVGPLAIGHWQRSNPHSVDAEPNLAHAGLHAARKRGGAIVRQVVDHRSPGVALIREVGDSRTHAGVEHRPRLEPLDPTPRAGCLAAAGSLRRRARQPVTHCDQGWRIQGDPHHGSRSFKGYNASNAEA